MWKAERSPRPSDTPANGNSVLDDPESMEMNVPDAASFIRSNPGAQQMLDDLRNQPGFGVVMTTSELPPAVAASPNSIGSRLTGQLDSLSTRERQVLEIKELATNRVVDLTTEQLRRILEFMV